jgi:uncharacterized membrane protein
MFNPTEGYHRAMRIRVRHELLALSIITLLLVIAIIFSPSPTLRIVLGLLFVLFLPGYTLIAALFPKKSQLDGIERVALSFGLSIAVVPLTGFILNYTPWGIRLYPVLIAIIIFTFATSLIAWYRRYRLAEVERFTVSLNLSLAPWRGQSLLDKVLAVILIVTLLGAVGTLGYVIAAPKIAERFTEFYLLGPEGKAEGYPQELVVGEEARVIVGIVNHEYETVNYRVEVTIEGVRHNEIGPLVLGHEDKWEREVGFIPAKSGEEQKVEFLLYKQGQSKPYRSLYLWVNLKEQD